jgi:outer membrane protein assembly factor BamE (lipoprotein component of BamABCDE complex)
MPHVLKLNIAAVSLLAAGLTACAPTISQRGYFPDPTRTQAIAVGVDTKQTISDRLGTPTLQSAFDPDVWYYVSQTQLQVVWYQPWVTKEDVIEVRFDDQDRVASVTRLNEADMHKVEPVKRITPTRGRELTFWEQMFGNIGHQLPGVQNQENIPGQTGPNGP